MFSKNNRLAKDVDVQTVFKAGRTFFDPYFTIKVLLAPQRKYSRFTVVVSTKVSKLAVVRNRIKRVLREYLRLHMANMPFGDYMVIVRPKAMGFTGGQLRGSIEEVLTRNRLLKIASRNSLK